MDQPIEVLKLPLLFTPTLGYQEADGDERELTINAVPEPGTLALLGLGFLGLGLSRRRKA